MCDTDLDCEEGDNRDKGTSCVKGNSVCDWWIGWSTHSRIVFGRVCGALVVTARTGTDEIRSLVLVVVTLGTCDGRFDHVLFPVGIVSKIRRARGLDALEG